MANTIQKDYSIVLLKAIAALLITNSHMGQMYGSWKIMATGGAIGDAIFFFCAGYTLFWSREADFANWYKRRINRIVPTLVAWALLHMTFYLDQRVYSLKLDLGAGWFFPCIFVYYAILFPLKNIIINRYKILLTCCLIIISGWYFIGGIDSGETNLYGANYFKWLIFFPITIIGSIIGKKSKERLSFNESRLFNPIISVSLLIASITCFYGICSFKNKPGLEGMQMLSIFPLICSVVFLWRTCNSSISEYILSHRFSKTFILFIGGLSLEIYVGQDAIFTTKLNHIFPLNIPIIIGGVICFAYFLRCCARLWSQTFKEEPYDWKAIFKAL